MQKMFKAIFCDICRRVAFQEQLEGGFQDIQCELNNMGTIKLVKCWIRNVWPLPQLHSLRSRLSHLH